MRVKEEAKKLKEKYYRPTPRKYRIWGDRILAVGGVITLFAPIIANPWLTAVSGTLLIIGKYLTNLASE